MLTTTTLLFNNKYISKPGANNQPGKQNSIVYCPSIVELKTTSEQQQLINQWVRFRVYTGRSAEPIVQYSTIQEQYSKSTQYRTLHPHIIRNI